MTRRQLVAAAAVLLAVLTVAGCREGAKDQAVIDRLAKTDIVTLPAGATKLNSTQTKGGGSDIAAIRGASSVLLEYASPLPPARVGEFYHAMYDKGWTLKTYGARPGVWKGVGADRSDPQTLADITASLPAVNDKVPAGTKCVVSVSVSATREK